MAPDDLLHALASGDPPLVLDVRTPEEYARGHVEGAVNIPHSELPGRLAELEAARGRTLVVYCESGRRSGIALDALHGAGFERALQLEGDMRAWRAQGRPLVSGAGD
jgi:rhodanese-related sulfurtransferase